MSIDPSKLKVFKTYSRKVSLRGVTSRYDNVECSTFISGVISFDNEEDFNKKSLALAEKVFNDTERDVYNAICKLKEMSNQNKNSAALGLGADLSVHVGNGDAVAGFEDMSEHVNLPEEMSEIDMDEIGKILNGER